MKQITTSVGFQDAKGTVVANGFLKLVLSQNAEIISGGGQVTTQSIVLPLDSNAKITATNIWFNDELSPSGTVYHAYLIGSNGLTQIQDLGNWSISGASADLSAMVPSSSNVSYSGAVLLSPTGQQNINGQTLNMEGASLGFSAASSTTADSFFSRLSAGVIAVGTAIGNALGTLKAAVIQFGGSSSGTTSVQASSTASGTLTLPAATDTLVGKATTDTLTNKTPASPWGGFTTTGTTLAIEIQTVDLTSQQASITTTNIDSQTLPAGQYMLFWNTKVTQAASSSSTLGPLTITYVDPDGVTQTLTAAAVGLGGSIATSNNANNTTAVLIGMPYLLNVKASTHVTYAMTYSSTGGTVMQYNLHIKLVAY